MIYKKSMNMNRTTCRERGLSTSVSSFLKSFIFVGFFLPLFSLFLFPMVLATEEGSDTGLSINTNPLQITKNYFQHMAFPYGDHTELTIEVTLDEGYAAYLEKFEVLVKSPALSYIGDEVFIEPQREFYDRFVQENKIVVQECATIRTTFGAYEDFAPGDYIANLQLKYQACNVEGFCLLPQTVEFAIPFTILSEGSEKTPSIASTEESTETQTCEIPSSDLQAPAPGSKEVSHD